MCILSVRHKTLTFYFQNATFDNKICLWSVMYPQGVFSRNFPTENYYFYFRPLTPAQVIKYSIFFMMNKELGNDEPIAMNPELLKRCGVQTDE